MKIRLTAAAIRDLRETRAYIAFDNPRAAEAVIQRIERAVNLIGERPLIGRPIENTSTREWTVSGLPYLVSYRVSKNMIEVLRIWHTSRERPQS